MERCLVLDMGYQPHRIVSWQRAITMLFQQKAELVEEYDEEVYRGKTLVIKMPAVVRLLNAVRRKRSVRFSRINVLTRDNWKCQYCGEKFPTHKLNYDHVLPRSRGGKTTWDNVVTSCYPCNAKKGDKTPEQAGMKLRKKPYKPSSLPVVAFYMGSHKNIPDAWASWCYWNTELIE